MTATSPLFNPFPGLRPFREDETHLFFKEMSRSTSLLPNCRAAIRVVMGASGSGKFVLGDRRAAACAPGWALTRLGANWRIASLRPGAIPSATWPGP